MEYLQIGSYLCGIFSVVCAAFVFVFVKPLNKSIDGVQDAVNRLSAELRAYREQQHRMEGEMRELKYSVQKAHDRIDSALEERANRAKTN